MARIYAKKVTITDPQLGEITFDSQDECNYFLQELVPLRLQKVISGIKVHPVYELQPAFTDGNGKKRKAINYEADFEFFDTRIGRIRVVDIKGWIGQDNAFPIHWKMYDYQYWAFPLEVLKYSKGTGFVPYEDYKAIRKGIVMDARRKAREAKAEAEALKRAEAQRGKKIARLRALRQKPNPTRAERERIAQLEEELRDYIV